MTGDNDRIGDGPGDGYTTNDLQPGYDMGGVPQVMALMELNVQFTKMVRGVFSPLAPMVKEAISQSQPAQPQKDNSNKFLRPVISKLGNFIIHPKTNDTLGYQKSDSFNDTIGFELAPTSEPRYLNHKGHSGFIEKFGKGYHGDDW